MSAVEPVLAVGELGEPECAGQQAAVGVRVPTDVGAGALDAEDRVLGRNLGVLGPQRRVAVVGDDELQAQAVVVREGQRPLPKLAGIALAGEPLGPELQRLRRRHAELNRVDHTRPGPAGTRARELEPGEDRSRRALLVGEVQVVRLGRIEVHGLLDHPQAEHVGIELDIPLCVAGDHRDVVHAIELHRSPRKSSCRCNHSRDDCVCNYRSTLLSRRAS